MRSRAYKRSLGKVRDRQLEVARRVAGKVLDGGRRNGGPTFLSMVNDALAEESLPPIDKKTVASFFRPLSDRDPLMALLVEVLSSALAAQTLQQRHIEAPTRPGRGKPTKLQGRR
jgi:hypothetical protein